MKKVLFLCAMMAMTTIATAQTWVKSFEAGDELKGTYDHDKYVLVDSLAQQEMAFYQPGEYWKVGIGGNVFMPDKRGLIHKKTYNMITYATIGFYDESNNLIKKWDNCMMELTNNAQVAEASKNIWGKTSKGSKEVVPYLMNNRGYVRIIIPTYRGKEFDFKVPCLNNE